MVRSLEDNERPYRYVQNVARRGYRLEEKVKLLDAPPASAANDPVPPLFVRLGPERVRDRSDGTAGGALHDFSLTVETDEAGFRAAKEVAARISDVLLGAGLSLTRGRVVTLNFLRAQARRRNSRREIEIWFRAYLEDVAAV